MVRKKKKVRRGRPNIPIDLHKSVLTSFRMAPKLHLALSHLSHKSGIPKGEFVRIALLRYFKALQRREEKREKEGVIVIDKTLPPLIDYTFLFDDDKDIPDEIYDVTDDEEYEDEYY